MKTLRTAPDFDEAASITHNQVPYYNETAIDPDYDEGSQGEFADDFTEPDYEDAGQEYQPRKQK